MISLVLLGIINFSIFKSYAFSDAYEFLWSAHEAPDFMSTFIRGGRPLYGYLNQFIFGELVDSISGLKWVRFFTLLLTVLFSVQLFCFFKNWLKWQVYESGILAFLIVLLPSFTVYMGWSVTYEICISLNLSFFAGVLMLKGLKDDKVNIYRVVIAFLLIVISLCFYQSVATAFLLPFIFYYTKSRLYTLKNLIVLMLVFLLSFAAYFFVFKFFLYLHDLEALDRSGTDLKGFPLAYYNFFRVELFSTLKGNFLLILPNAIVYLGLILLIGFFVIQLYYRSEENDFWIRFSFLVFILPLTYLPNLLATDSWQSSRTIAVAAIAVLFYQFSYLKSIIIFKKQMRYVLLPFVGVFIFGAFHNQNFAFAGLQAKEYELVRKSISTMIENEPERIELILSKRTAAIDKKVLKRTYSDEFGLFSTSVEWVPVLMFNQIVKEEIGVLKRYETVNFPVKGNGFYLSLYNQDNKPVSSDVARLDFGLILDEVK
jgi:hypothetical protein